MAKKKKDDQDQEPEGPVGVLDRQPDGPFTSESDLAKSEDYNPEDDVDPTVSGEKRGVLENQPNVSNEQGMDDILRFTGDDG